MKDDRGSCLFWRWRKEDGNTANSWAISSIIGISRFFLQRNYKRDIHTKKHSRHSLSTQERFPSTASGICFLCRTLGQLCQSISILWASSVITHYIPSISATSFAANSIHSLFWSFRASLKYLGFVKVNPDSSFRVTIKIQESSSFNILKKNLT